MNLEMLLEEERSLKEKIAGALESVKAWFEKKMEEVKEIFERVKDKVLGKIKTADVEPAKVNKAKSLLTELKTKCNTVVQNCKAGIRHAVKGDKEEALTKKEAVLAGIKAVSGVVAAVGAIGLVATSPGAKIIANGAAKTAAGAVEEVKKTGKAVTKSAKNAAEQVIADRITAKSRKANAERESKNEDFDFVALMEEIENIGEEVLEESFDFDIEDLHLEEDFDFDLE